MLETHAEKMKALLAARTPGYSLDAPFYIDPAVFAVDMSVIFGGHWLFAGTEAEVGEPGDYFTADFGPHSIFVVRADDMGLKAFHNVCRHRGARLLNDASGFVANIVCPYHQWTYSPDDGGLIHAEASPSLDKKCFNLKSLHVRSVAGLIFVCMAKNPPTDFDEFAKHVQPYVQPHEIQNCKVAMQKEIVEEGNWKLTIENNRECFHCTGHPELLRSTFGLFGYTPDSVGDSRRGAYDQYQTTHAECKKIWEDAVLPWEEIQRLDDGPTGFRIERNPLAGPGESMTMDGRIASKRLLGQFTTPRLGRLQFHIQPNAWMHLQSDHAVTFVVLPVSEGKTIVRTTWLVHKDAVEGVDYSLDNLTKVWDATNEQDKFYVSLTQKGAQNPAYEPGPYAPQEYQVEKFCNWYLKSLSAAI